MVQQKFSPKYLFLSNGANSPTEFPTKVGAGNTNGIFSCGDWFPDLKSSGNPQFVAAYLKKYGGEPDQIDPGSAEAYAVGQLVEEVAAKTKKVDNKTIITSLHQGTWPVVEGNLSWNPDGSPKGSDADGRVGRRQAACRSIRRRPPCTRRRRPSRLGAARAPPRSSPCVPGGRVGDAPLHPGLHPGHPDRRRLRADGQRPHAGLRRDEGHQRRPGRARSSSART